MQCGDNKVYLGTAATCIQYGRHRVSFTAVHSMSKVKSQSLQYFTVCSLCNKQSTSGDGSCASPDRKYTVKWLVKMESLCSCLMTTTHQRNILFSPSCNLSDHTEEESSISSYCNTKQRSSVSTLLRPCLCNWH